MELEYFEEYQQFNAQIDKLIDGQVMEEHQLERFLLIIDKYQEMPQLLDPHLNEIVGKILECILKQIRAKEYHNLDLFAVLYALSKTRGHKIIVRFFIQSVDIVEPMVDFIQECPKEPGYWRMRFICILWLSLLCMTPFDFNRIETKPLFPRLIQIANQYSCCVGMEYQAASILFMRILIRKDFGDKLNSFINDKINALEQMNMFEMRGNLLGLCNVYKYGPRELLLETCHHIPQIIKLKQLGIFKNNALLRKILFKLVQRMALVSLKPKIASWRYQRGCRSLLDNLTAGKAKVSTQPKTIEQEEDEEEIIDELEDVVELLLNGLSDKDSSVRWISAKGLGRIANRIHFELADQIVHGVIDLLEHDVIDGDLQGVSDACWHGCMLCLAELVRRGLLLPPRLEQVMPTLLSALSFEQRVGTHSIGSNVRDSACYVSWSLARAYEPEVLDKFALKLAQKLLLVAITDREINIRRAASAAFQENCGRHGLFPHGLHIIAKADYFNVGHRQLCFTEILLDFCQFEEYRSVLLDQLVALTKHWDRQLVEQAAQGLGLVAQTYDVNYWLQRLLEDLDDDIFSISGKLLSLGHIVFGTFQRCGDIKAEIREQLISELQIPSEALCTFGSEYVRYSACFLIKQLTKSNIIVEADLALSLLESSLIRQETFLVEEAAESMSVYISRTGLSIDKVSEMVEKIEPIHDQYQRCGYLILFGKLDDKSLQIDIDRIIKGLSNASKLSGIHDFAECRRDAVNALTGICKTTNLTLERVEVIIDTFLNGMEDYSVESRGDVGSWIREASILGFEALLEQEYKLPQKVIDAILLAAFEKIDRVRAAAGQLLQKLSISDLEFPEKARIREILTQEFSWVNANQVYPMLSPLLDTCYLPIIFLGLVAAIGGLTESLVRSASEALLKQLENPDIDVVIALKELLYREDRIMVPTLETLELLLQSGLVNDPQDLPQIVSERIGKTKNVKKIILAIKIYGGFAFIPESAQYSIQKLLIYLVHPFPKIRVFACETLFLVITTGDFPTNVMEACESILASTKWEEYPAAKNAKTELGKLI